MTSFTHLLIMGNDPKSIPFKPLYKEMNRIKIPNTLSNQNLNSDHATYLSCWGTIRRVKSGNSAREMLINDRYG